MYKEIELITDEKTLSKIFQLIALYIEKGIEVVSGPMDVMTILFDDTKKSIESIIAEAKIAVIDEKIVALEIEYKILSEKKYKTSKKIVSVGDGFNSADYSVNFINERRRKRIMANILSNIDDLKTERKEII